MAVTLQEQIYSQLLVTMQHVQLHVTVKLVEDGPDSDTFIGVFTVTDDIGEDMEIGYRDSRDANGVAVQFGMQPQLSVLQLVQSHWTDKSILYHLTIMN